LGLLFPFSSANDFERVARKVSSLLPCPFQMMSIQSAFAITVAVLFAGSFARAELLAEFKQGETTDRHLVRLPALMVAEGEPATPLLEDGPFEVTWTGNLEIEKRQRLYFSFAGKGSVTLEIDGEQVLSESGELGQVKSERLRLNPGEQSLTVRYQSPESGAARFQLRWEERSFPEEPVPPVAFGSVKADLASDALLYHGREIFGRHLCVKCHPSSEGFGASPMPELNHVPPIVGLTGDRLQEEWLARWIADPSSIRHDTNMPRLVPKNEEGKQQAADLAAYLMTMKTGAEAPEVEGSAKDGGAVFHKLACVTCHGLPEDTDPSNNRVSLAHVAGKYQPHALRDFLLNPSQLAPHTRMPNFRLDDEEAADLTAYLLEASAKAEEPEIEFPVGNAGNGAALSKELQCGACHAGLPFDYAALPPFEEVAKKSWEEAACYHSEKTELNLPSEAGESLEALRTKGLDSLKRDTPASFTERHFKSLRCYSCHSRDGKSALLGSLHSQSASLAAHLNDEKLDQSLPQLTYVGDMLHTDYMTKVFEGDPESRIRTWLDARMPGFSNFSPEIFAAGFAAQHGFAPSSASDMEVEIDAENAEIGAKLISSDGGFGCTTCHGVGDQDPTAAFEVMGINFEHTKERLRENYFFRWMHDPTRITPDTKMPVYVDRKGETALPEFDNDSRKQFEAIWDYLQSIPGEEKEEVEE
jgi:mono/diheme cytochrome c family protein